MDYNPETLYKFVVEGDDYYLLIGFRELKVFGENGYGLIKLPSISWTYQCFGENKEKSILDHLKTHLLPD